MSVPTWKRNISKIEYLYQTYQLEKYIVQMVYNTPSKYRRGFGDTLISCCDDALKHGRTANGIFLKDETTYNYRRYELEQMKSAVDNIGTHVYVWVEAMRQHDGIDPKKDIWLYDKENEIGLRCDKIISLIEGVKKYDKKQLRKIKANNGA